MCDPVFTLKVRDEGTMHAVSVNKFQASDQAHLVQAAALVG